MQSLIARGTPRLFRFVATLEAVTWLGLLIGMAFKYLPEDGNQIGVRIFGTAHGAVFVVYLVVTVLTALNLKWNLTTTALAFVASVPPFATLLFEWWAMRTGRLDAPAASTTDPTDATPVTARR